MTDFDSTQHPRADTGAFTDKAQSAPGFTLPAGSIPQAWNAPQNRVPVELQDAVRDITAKRQELGRDECEHQDKVGAAFTAFILRTWPEATAVDFTADSDEPNDAPEFLHVLGPGWEPMYEAWTDEDTDAGVRSYSNLITGPYAEGNLLDPVEGDDGEQTFRFYTGRGLAG